MDWLSMEVRQAQLENTCQQTEAASFFSFKQKTTKQADTNEEQNGPPVSYPNKQFWVCRVETWLPTALPQHQHQAKKG